MNGAEVENLHDLLSRLEDTAREADDKVTVGEIVEAVGRRSFGPALLLAGLLGMSPVSAIPTAPSLLALIVVLIAAQMVFGRKTIWLPKWLQNLGVKPERVEKTVKVLQKPARVADRLARPRLQSLTGDAADRMAAGVCVLIALAVPPLELLPLAAFAPFLAIAIFGLGLIARDGLLVLIALVLSAAAMALLAYRFLG